MTAYKVENNLMDDYLTSLDRRRTFVFAVVTLIVLSIQVFIVYNLDSYFPFWIFIIVTAIIAIAFYFSLRLVNDKLKQLAGGQYFLNNSSVKFLTVDNLTREFNLDDIAVIDKKYSGTLIVKGNSWTKFNYIRPKRTNSYQIGELDIIFIPTITSNYAELVEKLKQRTKNAMKL
jgi:hypothetical protein